MKNENPKLKYAKKRLGQNFLTDKNKIRKIVDALELRDGDTVVEIGPGHGELTRQIAGNPKFPMPNAKLIAIEKDETLADALRNSMGIYGNKVEVITGDILKILPVLASGYKLRVKSYKLVGNIPFYITGFLLRALGELKIKPKLIILTVQKEVAERIAAKPPKMNLLAAAVQFWAEPEIIDIIPKTDFSPEPKVDSAVIKLTPRKASTDSAKYYPVVRALFKQPRKTVLNNLSSLAKNRKLAEEKLKKIGVKAECRPQNLSIPQIERLVEEFSG